MSDYERYNMAQTRTQSGAAIDEGLRSYMLGVYNYMALGIGFTAVVGFALATWAVNNEAVAQAIYGSPLRWILMFAPLAMIFLAGGVMRKSFESARFFFFAFAAVMGLSISSIFIAFPIANLIQVFAITSAMFGAMSLYGYTTKKDLSGWGSFLFMGLIGIIIASVVNIFLGSGMLGFIVSIAGVLIFSGLTAYDTQNIKQLYYQGDSTGVMGQKQVFGALNLYLNFLNMFMMLLQLMNILGGDE